VVDMERDSIIAYAMRRLTEKGFRDKLTAVAADGSMPIIPALLSDRFSDVIGSVQSEGGIGNIVLPAPGGAGYVVLATRIRSIICEDSLQYSTLSSDITMGLVIARVFGDGDSGSTLTYVVPGEPDVGGTEVASTELAGVAD